MSESFEDPIYDLMQVRTVESVPFPHTFRDEAIKNFMTANYLADESGSFSYRKAHRQAFETQDHNYLEFMREHFRYWADVAVTNNLVLDLFTQRPAEPELLERCGGPRSHAWKWFLTPIEIAEHDFTLGEGQHRITALRLFAPPATHVVCRVFAAPNPKGY